MQTKFDRDLGTRGRSLSLINSRTTVGQMPMATLTGIPWKVIVVSAAFSAASSHRSRTTTQW